MTQTDRVLDALKNAGQRGITAVDFQLPNVIDGGKPILRVAARIHDLEAEWNIAKAGIRDKCAVYVLHGRVTAPPMTQPIKDRDGWLIVHSCSWCFGCVARPEQACGPTTRALWSPTAPAGALGCRLNEARADRRLREQHDQEERRAA
jgi:hypothetical protein